MSETMTAEELREIRLAQMEVGNRADQEAGPGLGCDVDIGSGPESVKKRLTRPFGTLTSPLGTLARLAYDRNERGGRFTVTDRRKGKKVTDTRMTSADLVRATCDEVADRQSELSSEV